MNALDLFIEKRQDFLGFLKSRFNLFHESNVFFRDLHYGVMGFLQLNRLPSRYSSTEELTKRVIAAYVESKVLIPIDERTWMLNYVAFKKAPTKTFPVAKPVAKQSTESVPSAQRSVQLNSGPPATRGQMEKRA